MTERKNIYIAKFEDVTDLVCPIYMKTLPAVLAEKYKPSHF